MTVLPRNALVAALLVFGLLGSAFAQEPSAPERKIERLHAALIETRNDATLDFDRRYERLDPIVRDIFDFSAWARFTADAHWQRFDEDERAAYTEAVARLIVAGYAARNNPSNGKFYKVDGVSNDGPGQKIVHAEMVTTTGETRAMAYRLYRSQKGWKIFNVVYETANGAHSDAHSLRNYVSAFLNRNPLTDLIRDLDRKAEDQKD